MPPKLAKRNSRAPANSKCGPSPNNPDSMSSDSIFSNWSIEECTRLVNYIKLNGYDGDVNKISREFPGHGETNIRTFVSELCTRNKDEEPEVETFIGKLENLLELARNNNLSMSHCAVIAKFADWKSLFENHRDSNECGGVDYAEIYRAIASLMRGEIPRALNKPSAAKLLQICDNFLTKLMSTSPDLAYPQSFKKPAGSITKTQQQSNATLANRRSAAWSQAETIKCEELLRGDLQRVREIYLAPSWANPYRFPDEPSLFRKNKILARKNATNPTTGGQAMDGLEKNDAPKAPKKKRRRRN